MSGIVLDTRKTAETVTDKKNPLPSWGWNCSEMNKSKHYAVWTSQPFRELVKISSDPGWGAEICIFRELPGDSDADSTVLRATTDEGAETKRLPASARWKVSTAEVPWIQLTPLLLAIFFSVTTWTWQDLPTTPGSPAAKGRKVTSPSVRRQQSCTEGHARSLPTTTSCRSPKWQSSRHSNQRPGSQEEERVLQWNSPKQCDHPADGRESTAADRQAWLGAITDLLF